MCYMFTYIVGYKFSRASYVLSLLRPQIFKDLELKVFITLFIFTLDLYHFSNMFYFVCD